MNISQNKKIIAGILGIAFIIAGVVLFCEVNSYKSVITPHETSDPCENTLTMNESLEIVVKQERDLNNYIKGIHFKKNKEKVFVQFLDNLEYYSKVFSYDNENKYERANRGINPSYISADNSNLKKGNKEYIDGMEITPVFKGDSPPNSPIFPNLKITKPKCPFLKLVYNPWFCNEKRDIFDYSYIAICNGPNYFVVEPNYEYLYETYSKYFGTDWNLYFYVKIKQQTDLRYSAFTNGNGGMAPIYIGEKEIADWSKSFIDLLNKYPNFTMYDKVVEELLNVNYPEYNKLLEKLDKKSKLYDIIKKADEDLASEYE